MTFKSWTEYIFKAVESSLVGTSCQMVIRKLCCGTFFCKGKFFWGILRLIDHELIRNLHHAYKDPFLWLTFRLTDRLVDWLIASFLIRLCKLIDWCFEPCHKFSVSCQGTKYLNSMGSDIKDCNFSLLVRNWFLIAPLLVQWKKIAPLLSYHQELLQLDLKAKLLLFTAACRWG